MCTWNGKSSCGQNSCAHSLTQDKKSCIFVGLKDRSLKTMTPNIAGQHENHHSGVWLLLIKPKTSCGLSCPLTLISNKVFLGLNQYALKSVSSMDVGSFSCLANIQQKAWICLNLLTNTTLLLSFSYPIYLNLFSYMFLFVFSTKHKHLHFRYAVAEKLRWTSK